MALGSLSALLSMSNSGTTGPEDKPKDYRSVRNAHVQYEAQANGLVPAETISLAGHIQLLAKSDDLHAAYAGFAGGPQQGAPFQQGGKPAKPEPMPKYPVQIEGDHVRVARIGSSAPLLKSDASGALTGDQGVIEAYTTADRTYEMASSALGRDFTFAHGRKLTVNMNDPTAYLAGPHVKFGTGALSMLNDKNAERDPDVVSHETGHAILDAHRPEYISTNGSHSLHEAFGDATSLFTALSDPNVRRDVIAQRAAGQPTNLAATVGEGIAQSPPPTFDGKPVHLPSKREGLRDMAAKPPTEIDAVISDPHESSKKFTSGLYHNVLGVSDALQKENPKLSDDAALKQASDIVGRDFMRSVDFLPSGDNVTQFDLARAMIKADKIDGGGKYAGMYTKNFAEAGVNTDNPRYAAQEARVAQLGADPSMKLPSNLMTAPDYRHSKNASAPPPPQAAAAEQYLRDHSQQLGIHADGLHTQQMYHNNRGETFIYFSNGNDRYDQHATMFAGIGFDRNGHLIQASSGGVHRLPIEGVKA